MRLAAAEHCCLFRICPVKQQLLIPPSLKAGVVVVAADPCNNLAKRRRKKKCSARSWRAAAASGNAEADGGGGGGGGNGEGQLVPTRAGSRRARLSARRRERTRLEDGGGIGEFLRQPAGVESLLNTRALQSFAPVESPESESNTFRCTLHPIGFLGFQVAPVLDLRVTPTCTDCTVQMLSCRFEGSGSVEQQNELFSAFMSNHITWRDEGEEPFLDIDVNLDITLEVYTKPFSLLPLSAVEKPGNLMMQGLLDRLVPLLGEQLLRDYHHWVQLQQQQSETSS
ncbi:hypothetical protein GUJ93_ZPchr0010g10754 [Zizania palustris]|uniref:Uncharacterized protein n=1 Tax=Zizania palustris TaxID=103762 RepID=A0A8J6BH26_ZIZPA|nr:hypothetical protein GUJ93_ZPchr0010g10754 [Zizania palustris]